MEEFKRYIDLCGSQVKAAKRLGVSDSFVSQIAKGTKPLPKRQALKIKQQYPCLDIIKLLQ